MNNGANIAIAAMGIWIIKIYTMAFLILSYTLLPSLTDFTMVVKLSSIKIISAASLATSVPLCPIAIPISALFKAGASLTPSPVIATISPFFLRALTIFIFCSGITLENTSQLFTTSHNSFSLNESISLPTMTLSVNFNPISSPIAIAVLE